MAETAEQYQEKMLRQGRANAVRREHDTSDPDKIRSEIAADESKRRGENGGARSENGAGEKSLRRRKFESLKNLNAENLKHKAKDAVAAPIKMGTNRALQWAWEVLIPSWGLSIIYINMHVFLRYIFPDLFCKLGEEWVPKIASTGEHGAKNVAGTMFGIVEVMGLLAIDLLLLFVVLGALGIIVMIVDFMQKSWWEKFLTMLSTIWDLGWDDFIGPMVDLFLNKG